MVYGKGIKIANNIDKKIYDISEYKYLKLLLESHILINNRKVLFDNNDSEKQKINFLNKMTDNDVDYLIKLLNDFEEAKLNGEIKKNSSFGYNTNSITAWINKNDTRKILSIDYSGRVYYNAFGVTIVDTKRFRTEYGYHDKELISGLYEALQNELVKTEEQHFRENNEDQKLISKLRHYYHNSGIILNFDESKENKLENYVHKNDIETRMNLDMNLVKNLLNLYKETEQGIKQVLDKANEQLKTIL